MLHVGTTHAEIIRSPTVHLTKTQRLEPKLSNLGSSDLKDRLPPVMFLGPSKSQLIFGVF